MPGGSHEADMSAYERQAWKVLVKDVREPDTGTGRYGGLAESARSQIKRLGERAGQSVRRVPGADQIIEGLDAVTKKALAGLHVVFVERGLNSVGPAGIFSSFAAQGVPVSSYDDIRELDLRYCDQTVPRRKERYLLIAAGQGAATSLAVTGATVSSTVSGGTTLGVASVAVATDVTAVLVAASPAPTTSSASVDAGRSQNTHCGGGRTSTRPTTSTTHSSAPPTPSRTSTSARLRTGSTTAITRR